MNSNDGSTAYKVFLSFHFLSIAREEQKHFVEIESRFGRHFYNEGHSVYNMLLYGTYFLSIMDFLQFIFH